MLLREVEARPSFRKGTIPSQKQRGPAFRPAWKLLRSALDEMKPVAELLRPTRKHRRIARGYFQRPISTALDPAIQPLETARAAECRGLHHFVRRTKETSMLRWPRSDRLRCPAGR